MRCRFRCSSIAMDGPAASLASHHSSICASALASAHFCTRAPMRLPPTPLPTALWALALVAPSFTRPAFAASVASSTHPVGSTRRVCRCRDRDRRCCLPFLLRLLHQHLRSLRHDRQAIRMDGQVGGHATTPFVVRRCFWRRRVRRRRRRGGGGSVGASASSPEAFTVPFGSSTVRPSPLPSPPLGSCHDDAPVSGLA